MVTDLAKEKQGPAVYLSLTGRAKQHCRSLVPATLNVEGGVKILTDHLDGILDQDENTKVFLAFKNFYDYRRSGGTSITDFIIEYEYLYAKLGAQKIKLPEGVQAFFLLTACNVSEENEKLARATCSELTYAKMKDAIQKMFGNPASTSDGACAAPSIKVEPAFVSSEQEHSNQEESYFTRWNGNRRPWRGRGSTFRGRGRFRGGWKKKEGSGSSNPKDSRGEQLKCFKCGSKEHFVKDCTAEEVHFTLLSSEKPDGPLSALLQETLGMAILDSGCSKTVAGNIWMEAYLDQLSKRDRASVKTVPSNTRFRFGDGVESVSSKLMTIPVVIGKVKVPIEVNIVDNEIPLLLSRRSMKKAGCKLDFSTDSVTMLGQSIKLISTQAGHYCIPLTKYLLNDDIDISIVLHTTALENCSTSEKRKKALKLHRQFSHATKDKLCKFVQESKSFSDKEFLTILSKCCDDCELCQKFKRPPLRPVVGLPLANDFNQVVCMDLKEHVHNQSWMLHLIDAATRYSVACIIDTKEQDEIIQKIFLHWIALFGAPGKFLSDNGGEFDNESYRSMNEQLNVVTTTTAAESPFSNGTVERHNGFLYETMQKTMMEAKCNVHVALAWALSSKNALQNHAGYSPNQLVFGRNPNMPTVLTDKIPALFQSDKELIRTHLNAHHSARKAFIETESDERIRRALRHNIRTYADTMYSNGDRVYYRRKKFKGWKGPAVVLGQDGQCVAVRHGGAYYKCHPSQLMMVKQDSSKSDSSQTVISEQIHTPNDSIADNAVDSDSIVHDDSHDVLPDGDEDQVHVEVPLPGAGDAPIVNDQASVKDKLKPCRNTNVQYKLNDETGWTHAHILKRQPKQSKHATYKNWVNLHVDGAEQPVCINWDHVREWNEIPLVNDEIPSVNEVPQAVDEVPPVVPPPDIAVAEEVECVEVLLTDWDNSSTPVIEAKEKEIGNLERHNVFQIVPYQNQATVSSRWILSEKVKNGEKCTKARLVARGFEEDSSELIKDSPTCSREALRLVYLTCVMMSWLLQSMDISSAFLQGWPLEREVFLQPPSDVCSSDYCWKLNRCIYGLNDAPRKWYNKVKDVLLSLGAKVSIFDNALFLWHDQKGDLQGILASHVDDFMFGGTEWFLSNVVNEVKKTFLISSHELGSFKFLGLNIVQSSDCITMDQEQYISNKVEPIPVSSSRGRMNNAELNSDERSDLKRLSGQMLWASTQTRPDVSFETCVMSNMGKHPTVKKLHEANKALTKLKSRVVHMKFPHLGKLNELKVISYSDATYASLADGSSQGGVITFVTGGNGKVAPICWKSKKLSRVTKSPLASETLALSEGADMGFLVASMLQEIFRFSIRPQVLCLTDNSSLTQTLETSNSVSDMRLRVDIARLREMIREDEITVQWIPGRLQIADSLTKRGASTMELLNVLSESVLLRG